MRRIPSLIRFVVIAMLPLMPAVVRASDASASSSIISDGPVKATLTTDRSEARVADPIQITLDVEAPTGTRVELPKIANHLGDFDIRSSKQFNDIPSGTAAGKRHSVLKVTIDTIKTGELTIPAVDIHFVAAGSTSFKTLSTKPLPVHVTSVLENRADPTKFHDIKGTVDVNMPRPPLLARVGWTAACLVTALAAGLLMVIVKKRRSGLSPADWSLRALSDLKKLAIENPAEASAVVCEVVGIVREFFELEFDLPATTRTSRQLLVQAAKKTALSESARESLAGLLSLADEVKFTRFGVGADQSRMAIEQAMTLISDCDRQQHSRGKEVA